jgi:hypothetical protein
VGRWPAAFRTIGKEKVIQIAYWLKDDTEHKIKKNESFFSWWVQCHLQKFSTIFRFEVIDVWIKEVKKVAKSFYFNISFCNSFLPLIQTLITSKQKIVEEFQRWHWTRHEKISKTLLKRKKNVFLYFMFIIIFQSICSLYHFFFPYG